MNILEDNDMNNMNKLSMISSLSKKQSDDLLNN